MTYVKTAWIDGETPLSAINMNNLERQYDEAVAFSKELVALNAYDDYLRTLELYYTGHFTGPGIAGMRGMTFDGFMNTLRVDTANTDAVVSIILRNVVCKKATDTWAVSSAINGAGSSGLNDALDVLYINELCDGNDNTSNARLNTNDIGYATVICDLGVSRKVDTIRIKSYIGNAYYQTYMTRIAYSNNLTNWTVVDFSDLRLSNEGDPQIKEQLVACFDARYIAVEFNKLTAGYASGIHELGFKFTGYTNSTLRSTVKNLTAPASSVMLYASDKRVAGSAPSYQVSANNGINWESLDLLSTRADPLDAAYTEYTLGKTLAHPGDKLIFRVDISTNYAGAVTSEIKRYGLHWV